MPKATVSESRDRRGGDGAQDGGPGDVAVRVADFGGRDGGGLHAEVANNAMAIPPPIALTADSPLTFQGVKLADLM